MGGKFWFKVQINLGNNLLVTACSVLLLNLVSYNIYASLKYANELQQLLLQKNNISGNFSQHTITKKGQKLQQTKGSFTLKYPQKFNWRVVLPVEQLIISNGKKTWFYEPDLNQVTISNLDENSSFLSILTSKPSEIVKSFTINKNKAQNNKVVFFLQPKNEQDNFINIKIEFKGNIITLMELEDNLTNITHLKFTNIKFNQDLDKKLFSFQSPVGTDIINRQ